MDPNISAVVLLVGLAVGVDYSLFYLKREREERAAGRSARGRARGGRGDVRPLGADLGRHGDDRDGRDVLLRRQDASCRSPSRTMIVVAIAMLGSLTVLPAVLSKLGDRVEKGRIPFLGRLRRDGGENRVWSAILDPGAPPAADLRGARRRGVLVALAVPGAPACTRPAPGWTRLPNSTTDVADDRPVAGCVPGRAAAGSRRGQGEGRQHSRRPATRSPGCSGEALATGSDADSDRGRRVNADAHGRPHHDPARRATGTDATSNAALASLRDRIVPATHRQGARRGVRRHRQHGGLARLRTR